MIHRLSTRQPSSVWARFAALLSLMAVLSALLAPAAMLAEEVRTGKLGGLCSASAGWTGASGGSGGAAGDSSSGGHCDLCASVGLALPPVMAPPVPTFAGHAVVSPAMAALLLASDPGLPYSRGPPAA